MRFDINALHDFAMTHTGMNVGGDKTVVDDARTRLDWCFTRTHGTRTELMTHKSRHNVCRNVWPIATKDPRLTQGEHKLDYESKDCTIALGQSFAFAEVDRAEQKCFATHFNPDKRNRDARSCKQPLPVVGTSVIRMPARAKTAVPHVWRPMLEVRAGPLTPADACQPARRAIATVASH